MIISIFAKGNNITILIFGIVFSLVGAIVLGNMFANLKLPDEKIILQQLQIILKKIYRDWSYEKVAQAKSLVKSHSEMYKKIKELNSKYKFDRTICKVHAYRESLNSKRQFDNFDHQKWIFNFMDQTPVFFGKLKSTYEENVQRYNEYSSLYDSFEQYTQEIEIEDLDVEFEFFNHAEKLIFEDEKQRKIEKPSIYLEFSYVSPSGRNSYLNRHIYSYRELLQLIETKKVEEELRLEEKRSKEILAQQKREKERKLRELDKKEKQLEKRDKEIAEKEKEFLEATKEHVYTASKEDNIVVNNVQIEENMSITQKMKILRSKFDNGEITYDEYQKARKELL
jgi:hypothetical protein